MIVNVQTLASAVRLAACSGLMFLASGCCCTQGWLMNNSGMGYYQKGNYACAQREFQRAVVDRPRNPDYRHNLAMAMQKTGDVGSAEQVLRHNLTVDPSHQPTYHALAQLLISQQRTPEAEQLITEWRDTQPYVPESHVEMAWVQREMGNRAGAEQSLRQALQIKPNHPIALAHMGQLYQDSGQTDLAADFYQRSLLTRWNQPQVQSRLATVTGATGNPIAMRRSAMLQNNGYVQNGYAQTGGYVQTVSMSPMPVEAAPTMISYNAMSPVYQSDAITLNDVGDPALRGRGRRRAMRRGVEPIPAYPLPNYGLADAGMIPPNVVMSPVPMESAMLIGPTPIPEMSATTAQPQFATPTLATPTLATNPQYQADPAHFNGASAGIPVVDPY